MRFSEYLIPSMLVRDHMVAVPLDWSKPDGATIDVFAREIVDPARRSEDLPILCFLQGGPGGKAPRPTRGSPPWLAEALKTHRIVLPDQRGTGRSSPIEGATMARFANGEAAADYLACFRADSIVADCEHIRKTVFGGKRWQTLGQSYGGFITLTYLSQAPEGLSACYIAGGLPGVGASADEVYRRTYPRVAAKNAAYFARYPQDAQQLSAIADFIEGNDIRLPDGDRLTVKRLQTVGLDLGMGPGFENIHWLIDEAFADAGRDRLTDGFLSAAMGLTCLRGGPLFAALHEAIYADGDATTDWSAERLRAGFAEFDSARHPLYFTGEMIYPWMFEEIAALRPFKPGVESLARRRTHSRLYDPARLAGNEVPVAAVIYHDDMFVDAALSLETAKGVGNMDFWITNEFEHDGIRQSGAVFQRLTGLVRDKGGPLATA